MTASYLIDPMAVADQLLTDADAATDDRDEVLALRLCDLAESVVRMYEDGFDGWTVARSV